MMHKVPESIKFKRLQRRLGLPKYCIVGLLESLWITTQNNAPEGDIGKHDNEAIAIQMEWAGDPDVLVNALIETGWLDRDSKHRLIVHDWEEHAPGWIKRQLARHKKEFVTPSKLLTVTDDNLKPTPNPTQPNLTQENISSGSPPDMPPLAGQDSKPETQRLNGSKRFDEFWAAYPKKRKKADALKKWRIKHLDEKADEILADIEIRKVDDANWKDPQFIPDPTTYINGERWNDEVSGYKPKIDPFAGAIG